MNIPLLNFLFPNMCCICKRYGNYICDDCKKLLKRNLPECYICRRLSPQYSSHTQCRKCCSLDNVFVGWEYNHMSSSILKLYKYKNVREISMGLSELFTDIIQRSSFQPNLAGTLLIPVPISDTRRNERGFNQMEYITSCIGKHFNLDMKNDFIYCKNSDFHQASKNKVERYNSKENPFYLKNHNAKDISKYKSITLVDDVVTTGNTLEKLSKVFRTQYGQNLIINALCIFRGKPYYLPSESSPLC